MMTDTGNFSYNSCEPEMYNIVAMLLTTGINKDAIYDRVFNAYTADRMRLIGYCLYHKMKVFPEYHTALITLNRREMYRFNAKSGDMEGIVNMPLQIKDVYYSVFMREDKIPPHQKAEAGEAKVKAKISFRSQGDRPVNILAREVFRGGGHMNASGGEFFGDVDEAAKKFIEVMPKYMRKE
jgi:phosphoesterase RecJ-like protein